MKIYFYCFFILGCFFGFPNITQSVSYDFYVDAKNNTGIENGTVENPYKNISDALAAAEKNDKRNRKIFVKSGFYKERIDLKEGVKLYGENKKRTIIEGSGNYTVKMENGSFLKKVTIKKGDVGILIKPSSKASISDCVITKTELRAISAMNKNKKRSYTEITDCEIYENQGKGIYLQHGEKVKIKNNYISKNNGEGIDVYSKKQYSKTKGSITKNKISNNKENGIEIIAGKSQLKIEKNKIKNNHFSGISSQFFGESKKNNAVKISKNFFSNNKYFGISCENKLENIKAPVKFWKNSFNIDTNNKFQLNTKGEIKPTCFN